MYVTVPSVLIVTKPFAGWVTILDTVKVSPSKSVSFGNTLITTDIPGSVDETSSLATGASFIGVTVMSNVELAVFVPSLVI